MSEVDDTELRQLQTTLARALEEQEEQRVAAIELRMLLDASEARLGTMAAELEVARAAAFEAEERREAARVEAIEMRVILDATEHRAARLEEDLELAQRGRDEGGSEAGRLTAALSQALDECKVYDGLLQDAGESMARGDRAAEELELLRVDFEAQRANLEGVLQEARGRLGEAEERATTFAREASEAAASRSELQAQVETLRTWNESLEREIVELRGRADENQTLRQRLEEIEARHAEAERRHAEAMSQHLLELDQRTEALRAAEAELSNLREELELAQEMCNDSAEELTSLRREQEVLERTRREPEAGRPQRAGGTGLRLTDAEAEQSVGESAEDAPAPGPARRPARPEGERLRALPLTVVHLEDRPEYREALQAAVALYPRMSYLALDRMPAEPPSGPCLLVVNLLNAALEPLTAICSDLWGMSEPEAFTYCADAGRGVALGMIDYFSDPFDADACAMRMLAHEGGIQRLLVVSDHIDLMNEVRTTMARFKGSTSGALDARQAFELASLVRPELVLVDLALPRGEGLRVIGRLRSDPKTAAIAVACFSSRKVDASDLRAHAARVARDVPLAIEDFKRSVQQTLTERGFGHEPMRETA